MRVWVSVALACSLAACGSTTPGPAAPQNARGPSPGPRAQDAFDDEGLRAAAADVSGRAGDDAASAELRLLADQTRAFAVAVVRASRLPPGGESGESGENGEQGAGSAAGGSDGGAAGGDGAAPGDGPVFSPPATLVAQLNAGEACSTGGDPGRCAAQLGETLLQRLTAAHPPEALGATRDGLLTALAVFAGDHVPVDRATRWRVLSHGDDVGAHLAQALTLADVARQVAALVQSNADSEFSARTGARLSHRFALGPCSEAYGALADASPGGDSDVRVALAALAEQGCVPTCAAGAMTGDGDPVDTAALSCASSEAPMVWGPFREAARSVGQWAHEARTRLESVNDDPAVRAVLPAAVVPSGELPMPPPLFLAGGGASLDLPPAPVLGGDRLTIAQASLVLWVPTEGDVWIEQAPRFALTATEERAPVSVHGSEPLRDRFGAALAALEPASLRTRPPSLVLAHGANATRVTSALEALRPAGATEPTVVGIAMRHGVFSRYVAAAISDAEPAMVFRIGEERITLVEHGNATRSVEIPSDAGTDLGGAIPVGAPADTFGIELEPDATGLTVVRVLDALAMYGARATPARVPWLVSHVVHGALTGGVTDAAHATALRTAVDSHDADARRCLQNPPAAATYPLRVDLHASVDARGRVTTVDVHANTPTPWDAASQCLTRAARGWHLPAPGAAGDIRALWVLDAAPAAAATTPGPHTTITGHVAGHSTVTVVDTAHGHRRH